MEHVVFYTGADGAPQHRRTPSLGEAVRLVEHLRNVEGVEDSRVFGLTEVPLAFKTVYRVELPGGALDEPSAEPADLAALAEPTVDAIAEAVPVANGASTRGTGFFVR
ncbi:MAG: hypothetical protein QOE45_1498 [Frankiaceae bacterium]|nr:hypothetical protein [Frankiaceae bacterium]